MATTANHPDGGGKFMGAPAEPDEDIAAIAKQISDHAEVIYQTWKARGLAPNEILTCHNSLNAADQFGSVFTAGFSPPPALAGSASPPPFGTSSSMSPQQSPSPLKTLNGCKSPSKLPSPPPGVADFAYNGGGSGGGGSRSNSPTSANAASNLEQFVNKFVVEDKARLATRQKHDGPSPSAAKNYPSSIQYALQKFERRCAPTSPSSSDGGIANCASGAASKAGRTSTSPVRGNDFQSTKPKSFLSAKPTSETDFEAAPVTGSVAQLMRATNGGGADVDGVACVSYAANTSTWPLKSRSEAPVANGKAGAAEDERLEYAQRCQTLPSKMERRSSADQYLDEVAKEEERLINALKTGMVITANDAKMTAAPSPSPTAKLIAAKPANLICDLDAEGVNESKSPSSSSLPSSSSVKTTTRQMNLLNDKMENTRRTESGADVVCGLTPKRGRRPAGDAAAPLEPSAGAHRLNWRVNSGGANVAGAQSGNPVRPFLTRGSVAERVMMFEKCPTELLEKRTKATNATSAPWKNLASDVHTKIQVCGDYLIFLRVQK
ncbi:hypothetical protein V9T40_012433 [Parthenolecanium corni]|uniref:Uncharacterized protein n=1 Tax=Parthenolecanium corni TaxID=536013 RepID=A0AAN9TKE4_9HEMI